jgi:hypothetical protein
MRALDEDPCVGVVYCDRLELGLRSGAVQVPEFDLDTLLMGNFIDACAVIRKRVWRECGGFDSAMPYQCWEDWDFWISAAERGWHFHHLPRLMFEYRVRPGSMSWHGASPEIGQPQQAYIVEKHRDLYLQHLPQLLMRVQSVHREARSLLAEAARLRHEADTNAYEIQALLEEWDHVTVRLAENLGRGGAMDAERGRLLVEQGRWQAERNQLYGELESWRERVAFMEGTAAWRLRERLIRVKETWRRRRSASTS